MIFLLAILKTSAMIAVFAGAVFVHAAIANRRDRLCDACRLERQPGRLFVALAHTCSKRRALWRSQDGRLRSEFGRVARFRLKPPVVTIGKRRTIPEFTRQSRNVVPWKARA